MNASQPSHEPVDPEPVVSESAGAAKSRRKNPALMIVLAVVGIALLVPLALQLLAAFSPVAEVREQVNALGGRIDTSVAAPKFLQSMLGEDWDGWQRFYGAVEVSQILLNQCPVGDEDLVLLQKTPELRTLGLRGTKITGTGLSNLASVPKLQRLDMGHSELTDEGLKHLPSLVDLQELNIAGTRISDASAAALGDLKNLTVLDASETGLTDAALESLAQIPHLETLILDGCHLTDNGLASLKNCRSLKLLSLRGVPVTGRFVQELEDVPLERLNLDDSQCDGTELTSVETLRTLSLNHCPVADAGVAAIVERFRLEDLSLDHTQIDERSIVKLKDMPSLRSLSVNSTPVTASVLRELNGMPNLQLVKANGTQVTRGDVDALAAEGVSFAVTTATTGGR